MRANAWSTVDEEKLIVLQPDGARDDAIEKLDAEGLVSPSLGVQKEQLVRDTSGIKALFLQVEFSQLERAYKKEKK